MKSIKKLLGLLTALAMACVMAVPAFALPADPSITITNNNPSVSMEGHTYSAYKVMNLTYDGGTAYAYTINEAFKDFFVSEDGSPMTDAEAVALIESKKSDMQTFAAELLAYIQADNIQETATSPVAAGESVVIDLKDKGLGYYLVADNGREGGTEQQSVVAALALTTTAYEGQITLKADAPTVEKKIVKDGEYADASNAAIGDKVDYRVTSTVPDMTGYTKYFFVMNDTLSKGLTFGNDVNITVGGKTLAKDTDYTVAVTDNEDGSTGVKIVFKNFIQYTKGDSIAVTYSATLNEDAAVGNTGNTNDVTLTYSNNPTVTPGPGDEPGDGDVVGETPKDTVITYATGVELIKVDNEDNRLTGAEFEITGTKLNQVLVLREVFTVNPDGAWYKLKDGTYTETAPTPETEDKYEDPATKYSKELAEELVTTSETVTAKAFVGDDGVLRFDGLAAGDYVITELTAPDGFNLLTQPIEITISWTAPENVTGGDLTCTWKYALSGAVTQETEIAPDGVIQIKVVNLAGDELPETGGIGTTVFIVGGLILMIGAAVLLIARRKTAVKPQE